MENKGISMKHRKHVTEDNLRSSIASLRQKVSEATTPGMGQKGPTVAASLGQDPSNPLNKKTFNPAQDSQAANVASAGQAPNAGGGRGFINPPTVGSSSAGQAPKPAAPAGPPLVDYEKDFPRDTAIELQKKLNAAGEKLVVDGKMGPATRAAMKRHPEITTQTAAEKAVTADASPVATPADAAAVSKPQAPAAPAAPAEPAKPAAPTGVQAQGDDEGNTTITRPDGSTMVVGPDGKPYIPGSNPNLPQNQDMRSLMQKVLPNWAGGKSAPVVPNASNTSPWQKAPEATPPATSGQGPKPAPATPAPSAGPTSSQVQTDDDGNHMITTPDGKTIVVGPDGKPLPDGGKIAQAPAPAPASPTEKRTPAEIAASQDLSSANNAGNINAGLDPSDPRWQGPKPGPTGPQVWTESDELSRIVSLVHHR